MNVFCYKCGQDLEWEGAVYRASECSNCRTAIRSCKMCKFYDGSHYNECREPSAERVTDKEKANFCDYFKLREGAWKESDDKKTLLDQASTLFKD